MTMPRYELRAKLHESPNSIVYRGWAEADRRPVILKILAQEYPGPESIARFRREYEITHSVDLPGVIGAYSVESTDNRWTMVLEDFGGTSLDQLDVAGNLSVSQFLSLAVTVCDILANVHARQIIHKDINPSNLVWNQETQQVKLIDFGISIPLSRERPAFRNPELVEGTLAYMSPEQTGRMNRPVDYRTDLYSLGATFYELLTGRVPFAASDPLALVHAHLAKRPSSPHELDPKVPPAISGVVMKLLSKNAEDRYQSAQGLKADLETCLRGWEASGRIAAFPAAQRDVFDRFRLPQRLFGRAEETKTLLATFERVCEGHSAMACVRGAPGIGKTVLTQELHRPVTTHRGYFCSGKFEQLERDVPYSAWIQAMRGLMRQLLTEGDDKIATRGHKLREALGGIGQVIVEVVPELEKVAGPQPQVPELDPTESQNRFNLAFDRFMAALAAPHHPVVIFLDDLQWADRASLNLVQRLTAARVPGLFLIGAYRESEVPVGHPLVSTLGSIERAGTVIAQVALVPLSQEDVTQYVADTLQQPPGNVRELANIVHDRTGGNPFFVGEFLRSLYLDGLVFFDYSTGRWRWDNEAARERGATDNVVDLMMDRIGHLAADTQRVLQLAACIGNRFDLQTLATVHEKPPHETASDLWEAVAEELVLPLEDTYKLATVDVEGLTNALTTRYRFAHDRVQQACYRLIAEDERQAVHYRVGRLLLEHTPAGEREGRIIDIVGQLNHGRDLLTHQAERDRLARLNLEAGRKARASAAFDSAHAYFSAGLELIESPGREELSMAGDPWERCYELALALHEETAETAYITADYEETSRLTQSILDRATSDVDQARAYRIRIASCNAQGEVAAGLNESLLALRRFGVRIPQQPGRLRLLRAMLNFRLALKGRDIEDLASLPRMTSPRWLAVMSLLPGAMLSAHSCHSSCLPLLVLQGVAISAKHGNSPESALVYVRYGAMLASTKGDYEKAHRFGQVALALVREGSSPGRRAEVLMSVHAFFNQWTQHFTESLEPLWEAYQLGLETGEIDWSLGAAEMYIVCSMMSGRYLPDVIERMDAYLSPGASSVHRLWDVLRRMDRETLATLVSGSEHPGRLRGEHFDEEKELPILISKNLAGELFPLYAQKTVFCCLFHDYDHGEECVQKLAEIGETGGFADAILIFYASLIHLGHFTDLSAVEQKRILKRIAANQKRMKRWAHHGPMNYLHKYHLVEAERARVLGRHAEAREQYDRAIALAREHEFTNEEGLACELAGRYYLERGRAHFASHYLRDAHYAYRRWGAQTKVEDVERRYPDAFVLSTPEEPAPPAERTPASTTEQRLKAAALDWISLVKSSQAIASEVEWESLLSTLMNVVIESAGAQRGLLLTQCGGQWCVAAEGVVTPTGIDVEIAEESTDRLRKATLAESIVNYAARTHEHVVLDNSRDAGQFARDRYIIAHQSLSVLCLPLLNRDRLAGILYLENDLVSGAFAVERVDILQLMSGQIAISLENARLYRELRHEIREREQVEQALRSSEEQLRLLFDNAPLCLVEMDINRNPPAVVRANRQTEKVFGWNSKDITGMGIDILIPFEMLANHRQIVAALRAGGVVSTVAAGRRADQSLFPVRITSGVEAESDRDRLILAVEDITTEVARRSEAEAIDEERRRIAQEIHDGLAQNLASLRMKARLWHEVVDREPERMHAELEEMRDFLSENIRDVRRSIFALRPVALDELGFFPAVKQFVADFGEQYHITVDLEVVGDQRSLPPGLEPVLFRIFQEALHNVGKHARAEHASVRIGLATPGVVGLTVQDDGLGFDPNVRPLGLRDGHWGLRQVEERVEERGGTFSLKSVPGSGTTISVALPAYDRMIGEQK